jgi:hypothetical protein
MTVDVSKLRALDTETYRFRAGEQAPKIVCGSSAQLVDGKIVGELLEGRKHTAEVFRSHLDNDMTVAFANAAYDLAVLAQQDSTLLPLIFKALREGRIHDVLIAQSLDAIYGGHLGEDPRTGGDLRSPKTGKPTNRYSLEILTDLVLGRKDAKTNDVWRQSYALLDGIPTDRWPEEARQYPRDDAANTLEVAIAQIYGRPGEHEWQTVPGIPGLVESKTCCKFCNGELTMAWPPGGNSFCEQAPRRPHKNLENLAAQTEAAFALHLGGAWGLRTDGEKVETLAKSVEELHRVAVERFQKKGWIRGEGNKDGAPGTEDTVAIKTAVANAYGVGGTCERCEGSGTVRPVKMIECRGAKIKGRYLGCQGSECLVCNGQQRIPKIGNEITCKSEFDDDGKVVEAGCDGTGLDLSTAPMLPKTKKGGVSTDRDTLMESGDDDLSDFGENTTDKLRTTVVPFLRKGIHEPLSFQSNVIVATGRCSYEGSPIHQMPRQGGGRECFRARGPWCGYPVECVIGSTDYEAGELCTLAQYTYWALGESQMREAINATGKPGILHSDLAAQVLGLPLEEFLKRLKAKDKQCIDARQASKPYNFGRPGLMGSPKIVYTNRKSSTGFTLAEEGPSINSKKQRGYHGIRFCILLSGARQCGVEKIMEWKRRPCIPVCKACVNAVEYIIGAAYDKRYPEIKEYFNWVFKITDRYEGRVPCLVWDADAGCSKVVRWRGGADKAACCNNGFQAMLADIGKDAFSTMTREGYLGYKDDGSPSSLAGARFPLYAHDEPISELFRHNAHESGPRIAEIMMASGRKLAPDVAWRAETAIAEYWNKSMEAVYDTDGNLTLWKAAA